MTTIDLFKWKGNELIDDYCDFVVAGILEAKALGSRVTGSMVESLTTQSKSDGFEIIADRGALRLMSGQNSYYVYKYVEQGYGRTPAFDFLTQGFENVGDDDVPHKPITWTARKPSGRRGSGSARLAHRQSWAVENYRRRYANRYSVGIPASLRK